MNFTFGLPWECALSWHMVTYDGEYSRFLHLQHSFVIQFHQYGNRICHIATGLCYYQVKLVIVFLQFRVENSISL